jgi:predicted metal-dependent peptidase
MIAQQGCFELPPDALRDPKLEHLSVEEIYEILLQQNPNCSTCQPDLLSQSPCDASGEGQSDMGEGQRWQEAEDKARSQAAEGNSPSQIDSGSLAQARQAALEAHWRDAMQQALAIARSTNSQGSIPAGMQRELRALTQAKLDWRSYLWRYLVQTPNDFMGFDRRFIGRGLYLEALQGESVQVFVAVDTSGSIGDQQMQLFLSEVQGILKAYPHLTCDLYYADAQAYGPYPLKLIARYLSQKGVVVRPLFPFLRKLA